MTNAGESVPARGMGAPVACPKGDARRVGSICGVRSALDMPVNSLDVVDMKSGLESLLSMSISVKLNAEECGVETRVCDTGSIVRVRVRGERGKVFGVELCFMRSRWGFSRETNGMNTILTH